MAQRIIAIYPGRFQPMGKHHYESYKWLASKFGKDNTYIATSNKVDPPKSPLSFVEKKAIADKYGIGDKFVQVKNPYQAEEITTRYDDNTAVIFMVGQKDMQEDPRFSMKPKKDGSPSYFKKYDPNSPMEGYKKHGYLIVAPHASYDIKGVGEMSGTNIRKALSNPKSTPEQFKDIFGWYDKKIESMLKSKFSSIKERFASYLEERAYALAVIREMLIEGGAAGHMAHPFDIPSVKNGSDLIKVLEDTANFLQKTQSPVKIDGVNSSIRLANINGKKQFVLDRGSNKPLDVKGVTSKDLLDRFGEGHGMIRIGGTVLDIFNAALPKIKTELDALGMLKNPNIMLNIEYVEGQSNVQKYDKNFLAIHNLLELKRVSDTKRATQEISYDKKALQSLISKVDKIAQSKNFEVVGEILTKPKSKTNFSSALSKTYTVVIDKKNKQTKSLSNWLKEANNTKGQKLKLKDGKTVDALSKQVFMWIKNQKPVEDLVADKKDYKLAIDSFVIYEATMTLGDAILESLTSDIGDVNTQEGVVVRNPKIYDKPYKITGSFIVRGLDTQFGK
jgi:hypothetical protein